MAENLPTELWHLVWAFGWDFRPKKHPFEDLERVCDIQRSIPSCLLRDRVPPKEWVGAKYLLKSRDRNVGMTQLYQLFPPNPFKSGNPYRPFGSVDPDFFIWSVLPSLIVSMLTTSGIHELVTYRAVLERRLTRHYSRPILQWNKSLEEVFLPLSDLEEKYFYDDLWKGPFIRLVLEPLQAAAWLSSALP